MWIAHLVITYELGSEVLPWDIEILPQKQPYNISQNKNGEVVNNLQETKGKDMWLKFLTVVHQS